MELQSAQHLATVILNLAVALAVGASMSSAWLGGAGSRWARTSVRKVRSVALAALGVAMAADIGVLWLEAAAMGEVPLSHAGPAVYSVLGATHYGSGWLVGIGALALAAIAVATRARAALWLRLAALGVFLYSRSIIGHAGAEGDASWAVAADWLHLVLVSAWVGEVLVAGLVTLRRAASGREDRLEQARYVQALSDSATLALAGIGASGLYAAWRALGSLDNVTGNPYASVLLVKVSLVAGAAILGGANRVLVMPPLMASLLGSGDDRAATRFARVLQVEALLLVAVLIAAAVLSSTSAPSAG